MHRVEFGKNVSCLFNLWKKVNDVFFILVYLCFICILLLIVGVYLVIIGILTILCFISVIWNLCLNCLKGLVKSLFCSLFRKGARNNSIFQNFPSLILVLLLGCLRFYRVLNLDVKFVFQFMWKWLLNLILLLSLLKNQFRGQGLVIENICFLDFLGEKGLSKFFWGSCILFDVSWYILFVHELPFSSCSV